MFTHCKQDNNNTVLTYVTYNKCIRSSKLYLRLNFYPIYSGNFIENDDKIKIQMTSISGKLNAKIIALTILQKHCVL
jgi:hypothetical protein